MRTAEEAREQTSRLSEQSPGELLQKGQSFFESEDFYSAYYYAQLAKETAGRRGEEWTEANRLAARANERIEALGTTRSEREGTRLFMEKKRGLEALATDNPELHVEAYYTFKKLSREYPDDPEVRRYLKESEMKVADVSFFVESAEEIRPIPGERDIVFVNFPNGAAYQELVYFRKVVWKDTQIFVEGIEIFAVDDNGAPVFHLRAPFAQIIGQTLVMRGIDQELRGEGMKAEYLFGEKPDGPANIVDLVPSDEDLPSLSIEGAPIAESGFFELWQMVDTFPRFGYDSAPVESAGIQRLMGPFVFFSLSLLSVALGWRLRTRRRAPPIWTLMLLPLFPFIIHGLVELYRYLIRLLSSMFVLSLGYTTALIAMVGTQAVILIGVIFILAGTPADPEHAARGSRSS